MAQERSEDFKTPLARLSFAKGLFQTRAGEDDGKEKFGATLIFPLSDRPALEKIVGDLIIKAWGPEGIQQAKAGLIKSPFLKGDGKEARSKKTGELHAGMGPDVFFIRPSANADHAPVVIWKDRNKQETEATVYSGCYGKAVLNAFCWNNPKNGRGVSFGISMFQKLQEGERLGGSGGPDVDKWAEAVEDSGPAPESTQSGAGAGGLFG